MTSEHVTVIGRLLTSVCVAAGCLSSSVVGPPVSSALCKQRSLSFAVQLMSAVKKGQVADSRLAILMKSAEEKLNKRGPVTVDRSGGGV